MGKRVQAFRRRACGPRRGVALAVAALAVATACGSDGEASRSDADQCRDMLDAYCAKEASCAPSTERTNRGEDCEFSLKLQTPCEHLQIHGDMASCLNALDGVDCGSYDATKEALTWPNACRGIVGVP